MKPMKWEGDDESDDESKGKSARDSTTSAKNVGSKYDYSKKQPKKTTDTSGLAHQAEAKTAPQVTFILDNLISELIDSVSEIGIPSPKLIPFSSIK